MKKPLFLTLFSRHGERIVIGLTISMILIAIVGLISTQSPAYAQSGSGFSLSGWTVDSGGVTIAQGGGYSLDSTVGQPEAAQFTSTGSGYGLQSGFLSGSAAKYRTWYYPVVLTP